MTAQPRLIAYLTVADAPAALALYAELFGFKETLRLALPDGRLGHAELELEGSRLYLASAFPEAGLVGPEDGRGTSVSLCLSVAYVDAQVERARAAGCTIEAEPRTEFHGARSAKLSDPFGHRWLLEQRLEQLSNDEIRRRFEALFEAGGAEG
jgi:PhnB protein